VGKLNASICSGFLQRKAKRRPLPYLALDPNAPTVPLYYVFDDGQAESGAAHRPRPPFVDPVKTLEHPWLIVYGNAYAPIGHLNLHLGLQLFNGNNDLSAIGAVFYRIVDEVFSSRRSSSSSTIKTVSLAISLFHKFG
jgi:hypothetical protein